MSKKGKGKGRKGKQDKIKELTLEDYERIISELNNKLARLRSRAFVAEIKKEELSEKLLQIEDVRIEVNSHLIRVLDKRENKVNELQVYVKRATKTRNDDLHMYQNKIATLEAEYNNTYENLRSELNILNKAYSAVDSIRVQHDEYLSKLGQYEKELATTSLKRERRLMNFEQAKALEASLLKKLVQSKMEEFNQDCARSHEIRIAAYLRQLVDENVMLQKNLDYLTSTQLKLVNKLKLKEPKYKQLIEEVLGMRAYRDDLVRNINHKISIIDDVMKLYDNNKLNLLMTLKTRRLYMKLIQDDSRSRIEYRDGRTIWQHLKEKIKLLSCGNIALVKSIQMQESEIEHLTSIIEDTRIVLMEVKSYDKEDGSEEKQKLFRQIVVEKLLDILCGQDEYLEESLPHIRLSPYRPGNMGLMPLGANLDLTLECDSNESSAGDSVRKRRHISAVVSTTHINSI